MKLDLNVPNVKEQELSVEEIRSAVKDDTALNEKIYGWLDEAQGDVFSGKHNKVYLVIEITKQ